MTIPALNRRNSFTLGNFKWNTICSYINSRKLTG